MAAERDMRNVSVMSPVMYQFFTLRNIFVMFRNVNVMLLHNITDDITIRNVRNVLPQHITDDMTIRNIAVNVIRL